MGGSTKLKEGRSSYEMISLNNSENSKITHKNSNSSNILDNITEQLSGDHSIINFDDFDIEDVDDSEQFYDDEDEIISNYKKLKNENSMLKQKVKKLKEYHDKRNKTNKLTLKLLENKKDSLTRLHHATKEINDTYKQKVSSNEFYQERIERLNQEIQQSGNVLADFKKVIVAQKNEIEEERNHATNAQKKAIQLKQMYNYNLKGLQEELDNNKSLLENFKKVIITQKNDFEKQSVLIEGLIEEKKELENNLQRQKLLDVKHEEIKESLNQKHDHIKNIHEMTKELMSHYKSKAPDHDKVLERLSKDKEKYEKETHKVIHQLKDHEGKNHQLELSIMRLENEHKKEIRRREKIIEELYSDLDEVKKEAQDKHHKSEMYETIAIRSKNESLALHDEFSEMSKQTIDIAEKNNLLVNKMNLLEAQSMTSQKQVEIVKEEYEKRVQRIKQKQEEELTELITNHTQQEMVLKSQIYSLSHQFEELQKSLAREKQQKQELAQEINQKMTAMFRPLFDDEKSDEQIIYNVPRKIKEDYSLYDDE